MRLSNTTVTANQLPSHVSTPAAVSMAGDPPPPHAPAFPAAKVAVGNPPEGSAPPLPALAPAAAGAEPPSKSPAPGEESAPVSSPSPQGGVPAGDPGPSQPPPAMEDLAVLNEIAETLFRSGDDPDASFWEWILRKLESEGRASPVRLKDKDAAAAINPATVPMQTATNKTDATDKSYEFSFPSDCSDQDMEVTRNRKRKTDVAKQLVPILGALFDQVMQEQERMQKRLVKAIEKMENNRTVREGAWRRLHMDLAHREMELRMQERVLAASREQALVSFKLRLPMPGESSQMEMDQASDIHVPEASGMGAHHAMDPSAKRWRKCEVQALVRLREDMEDKFQETSIKQKGKLWEVISSSMASMGYARSAKRCKEKWNNVKKYFSKVRAGNWKQLRDPRTYHYFCLLETLQSEGGVVPPVEVKDGPDTATSANAALDKTHLGE